MQTVFVQWSASDVWSMTFIRWQRRLYPRPFVANKNGDGWVKGKRDKKGWWGNWSNSAF